MVCPFRCVVMIPSGCFCAVVVVFFSVIGSLLPLGAKKGFPIVGKSLSAVGYSVLRYGQRSGLRLSLCPIFPRLDAFILPAFFKVFRPVFLWVVPMISAALFLLGFFDFLPHLPDFFLCRLCKLCQFVSKLVLPGKTCLSRLLLMVCMVIRYWIRISVIIRPLGKLVIWHKKHSGISGRKKIIQIFIRRLRRM